MSENSKEPTRAQAILLAAERIPLALHEILFDYPRIMFIRAKDAKEPIVVYTE